MMPRNAATTPNTIDKIAPVLSRPGPGVCDAVWGPECPYSIFPEGGSREGDTVTVTVTVEAHEGYVAEVVGERVPLDELPGPACRSVVVISLNEVGGVYSNVFVFWGFEEVKVNRGVVAVHAPAEEFEDVGSGIPAGVPVGKNSEPVSIDESAALLVG